MPMQTIKPETSVKVFISYAHADQELRKKLEEQIAPLRKKVEEIEKPYKTLLMQLKRANLEAKYRDALDIDPGNTERMR